MFSKPDEALIHWYSLFRSVLDSHTPLKKKTGVSKGNSYLNGSTVKFKPQLSRGTTCIEKQP